MKKNYLNALYKRIVMSIIRYSAQCQGVELFKNRKKVNFFLFFQFYVAIHMAKIKLDIIKPYSTKHYQNKYCTCEVE